MNLIRLHNKIFIKLLDIVSDMKKFILLSLLILILNSTEAIPEATYSAFTQGGKALVNELSFLNKSEKFRIIFFTDKKRDYQLVIKPKNKPSKKQIIEINERIILPPNDQWFHLGKTKGLTIQLTNSDTDIKLEFIRYELKNNSQILNELVEFIGEEEIEEFISYPYLQNHQLTNDNLTVKEQVFRSIQNNFKPDKYKESVVLLETPYQSGAGFLIAKNRILTNWHLVKDQKEVNVRFKAKLYNTITKRSARKAQVISIDKEKDLALLDLGHDTSVLPFSIRDSTDIEDSFKVHTYGHPYGLNWSYNTGIISAKRSNFQWNYKNSSHKAKLVYQTQIPIDKGNSGGPLFDENGSVLGIVTFFQPQNKTINISVSSKDIQIFLSKKIEPFSGKKSKKVKSKPFDCNKEGVMDCKILDTDNDGIFETKRVYDSENKSTIITTDRNGNGIVEVRQEIILSERFKKTALIFYDLNEDGVFDYKLTDYGYNGIVNFEEKI